MQKFCTRCGKELPSDNNYCVNCGDKRSETNEIDTQQNRNSKTKYLTAAIWLAVLLFVISFFVAELTDPSICGNGVIEKGESCDDGNLANGDGCTSSCKNEALGSVCGNRKIEPGEACDDGNLRNGDGCSGICHLGLDALFGS